MAVLSVPPLRPGEAAIERRARPRAASVAAGSRDLATPLEQAAAAIGRLDALARGHPLLPAWAWRSRLDAVRRQAAVDGRPIEPWHLAAVVEGVRFRIGCADGAIAERGAVFDAARYALGLWQWFVRPDPSQTAAIRAAQTALRAGDGEAALLAAAASTHAWLDCGGTRAPMRAALAGHWQRRGLLGIPGCALLTGARALAADTPWGREAWTGHFLAALAEEAEAGLVLLRQMERHWFEARAAVAGRRRDSHAAAAIDVLAAAPLVSATSLAAGLGLAVKNAAALLAGFAEQGIAVEVTRRAKRRLYALAHLAPLRAETVPPRRPQPGRRRGRPRLDDPAVDEPLPEAAALAVLPAQPLSSHERREFDLTDLNHWMLQTELAIRRTSAFLERLSGGGADGGAPSDVVASAAAAGVAALNPPHLADTESEAAALPPLDDEG